MLSLLGNLNKIVGVQLASFSQPPCSAHFCGQSVFSNVIFAQLAQLYQTLVRDVLSTGGCYLMLSLLGN